MDEKTKRYRSLEPGEVVKEGDQVLYSMREGWAPVKRTVGGIVHSSMKEKYRRPLPDLWAPTQSPQTMPDGPGYYDGSEVTITVDGDKANYDVMQLATVRIDRGPAESFEAYREKFLKDLPTIIYDEESQRRADLVREYARNIR